MTSCDFEEPGDALLAAIPPGPLLDSRRRIPRSPSPSPAPRLLCCQRSMETQPAIDRLKKSGLLKTQGLVSGKWIDAYDGKTIQESFLEKYCYQGKRMKELIYQRRSKRDVYSTMSFLRFPSSFGIGPDKALIPKDL